MSGDVSARLASLAVAARVARGRLDDELADRADAVVQKAGVRLRLGVESTVVALAGPTGAGKSSLFNVLTDTELAAVGRRRPTTSFGQAAVWGDGADPLLDWLEVARRHRLAETDLSGLVLVDLPDFDSVEVAHRVEVDRVVELADLLVWVVDPQKYADAVLHEQYLRPLAAHAAAMAVVLNQADLLAAPDVAAWRADVERLLEAGGLRGVPLVTVSARTRDGVAELRALLAARVAAHDAAVARLAADVAAAAQALASACTRDLPRGVKAEDRDRLAATLADAAGVPAVVRAAGEAHRRRGALATGWPFVRWVRRFRPDPLRRLHLTDTPGSSARTSLPPPTDVQRAQVATATRRLADRAGEGLPAPWPGLVRAAAAASDDVVPDRLDRAVGSADLHLRPPRWWAAVGGLQRLLALAVAVGIAWLLVLAVLGYLRVDEVVPLPEASGVPVPTWLLVGGALAGIALALLARLANGIGAGRRSRAAARSLRARVDEVARELVVAPVETELEAYTEFCSAVAAAADGRRGRRRSRRT